MPHHCGALSMRLVPAEDLNADRIRGFRRGFISVGCRNGWTAGT